MKVSGASIRNSKRRGEWAELRFMARAAEHGFGVSKPWGDSYAYDFVVEHEAKFLRVQVKSTTYRRGHSYFCHLHAGNRQIYTSKQTDFVAVYIIPKNIWFIFPIDVVSKTNSNLILSPHLQNSRNGAYEEAWHLMRGEEQQVPPLRSG
jgi:PD-(D/E)XK endonuclease